MESRLLDQRDNLDGGERGLAAALVVEGADPDQAVGTRLDAERAVGVGGLDLEGGGLQPGLFGVGGVHDGGRVAVAFGPAQVHPQQHFGEVRGVHAAGAGADGDDGFALVEFAGQQGYDLEFLQRLADRLQFVGGFAHGVGVILVLAQLHEDFKVVDPRGEGVQAFQLGLAVREPGGDDLRGRGVVPQIGLAGAFAELGDVFLQRLDIRNILDGGIGGAQGADFCGKINVCHGFSSLRYPCEPP